MNALQEQFIAEARELVHQATDDLIAAEREGFSADRIERVFRAFHTLKGSAGVVDLPTMGLTLHAAEDLLAAIQADRVPSLQAAIDRLLACLDQVSAWVDDFEAGQALPSRAGEDARLMADQLRALVAGPATAGSVGAAPTRHATELPDWVKGLIDLHHEKIPRNGNRDAVELFAVSYEPHTQCFYNGDDPIGLMRSVQKLLAFHIEAREPWSSLGELDPFSCNLRFLAISAATRDELAAIFRFVPDQVRIVAIRLDAVPPPPSLGTVDDDAFVLVRAVIEEQRQVLRVQQGR